MDSQLHKPLAIYSLRRLRTRRTAQCAKHAQNHDSLLRPDPSHAASLAPRCVSLKKHVSSSLCRQQKATLVIAKLDRLARNVHFISGLMESGVEFLAVNMPSANRFVVHILAAVAEQEAEAISKRIKAALAAAKQRGTVLGGRRVSAERFAEIGAAARQTYSAQAEKGSAQVLPIIADIQGQGIIALRGITAELNARAVDPPRGGLWNAVQVQRVLAHIP